MRCRCAEGKEVQPSKDVQQMKHSQCKGTAGTEGIQPKRRGKSKEVKE
jgi:hypothetical protein